MLLLYVSALKTVEGLLLKLDIYDSLCLTSVTAQLK